MKDTHSKMIVALFVFAIVAIIALFIKINRKGVEIVSSSTQKKVTAEIKQEELSIKREELDVYFKDVEKMLGSARAIPKKSGDEIIGFTFTEIQDESVWKKLGIKNGDVITHINDDALNSGANVLNVYTSIKSASELEIRIIRASEPRLLRIFIR